MIGGYDALLAITPGTLGELRDLGIQVLPSPAAAGLLVAVDAAGLLISDDDIRVDIARHASLLLDDGGTPAGTTTLNLFQTTCSRCARNECCG